MRRLQVKGTPFEMGRQHARQVQDLRADIERAMILREAELAELPYDYTGLLQETSGHLEVEAIPTWEMLRGIADGLGFDWWRYQRYTLSSFLLDFRFASALSTRSAGEGCSNFAAAAPTAIDGEPLLAKNRDYRLEHSHMQTVTLSEPAQGFRYLHLGSAGSPGVFSAGINDSGVAIADTHVVSRDLGPGLPRYALMLDVLERCSTTAEALSYLRNVRHMGGGTLILADAGGELAVWESGHRQSGFVVSSGGWVVTTNHFATPALRGERVNTEPRRLRGHSEARRRVLERKLATATGQVDLAWAQALLGSHEGKLGALCRHTHPDLRSATISGMVLLPARRQMVICAGYPCLGTWQTHSLADAGTENTK